MNEQFEIEVKGHKYLCQVHFTIDQFTNSFEIQDLEAFDEDDEPLSDRAIDSLGLHDLVYDKIDQFIDNLDESGDYFDEE